MNRTLIFTILLAIAGCSPQNIEENAGGGVLAQPTEVTVSYIAKSTDLKITWVDNSDSEDGFSIFYKEVGGYSQKAGEVGPNVTEFILGGLTPKTNYYIGVRADNLTKESECSEISYSMFFFEDHSKDPIPFILEAPISHPTCISVKYNFDNLNGAPKKAWGLCWSSEATPTLADFHCAGPDNTNSDDHFFQLIPNPNLEYGTTYNICAYVTTEAGTFYSEPVQGKLGTEPEAITLNWTEVKVADMPASVKVYSTTDKLNGNKFNAWYAIADLSAGDVTFKMQRPAGLKSVKNQMTTDCLVLVNGPYFGSTGDYGYTKIGGSATGQIGASRGSLRTAEPEYNIMYKCTKGIFGIDSAGEAKAVWGATGVDAAIHFFDSPLPTVKGSDMYSSISSTVPQDELKWKPRFCATAGPVLVKNGKCVIEPSASMPGNDYYLTNYEIIAYDIFGASVRPDRTAVGVTADGKIILFVCDGRISASNGATIFEMAQIMKGLGCKDAVNYDGGGSTAMVVKGGTQMNYTNGADDGSRAVGTTMGFFKIK